METYQSVLLERVENNESEMRKLETTAKRNLGNFTLGKNCAADILPGHLCFNLNLLL